MRFSGKTALVTGAAGGIGQAIVTGLRAEGARVAAADRDTSAILADAHLDGDLLNPEYCDGLIAAAVDHAWHNRWHNRCRLDPVHGCECRGALSHLPHSDPCHGATRRWCHREHVILLGR